VAKVLNPLNSVNAKGSVAGLTYSMWRGINTVKAKPKPVTRHVIEQPANRALLGYLSRAWGLLTDAQRQLWRDYAAEHPYPDGFGGTFILTGNQMYNALNHNAIRLGNVSAEQDEPPTVDPVASILAFTAETGETLPGDIDLVWAHLGTPVADDFNEIWISPFLGSEGKVNVDSRMRYYTQASGVTSMLTIPNLLMYAWYWIKIRYIDKFGQKTAWHWGHATPKVIP